MKNFIYQYNKYFDNKFILLTLLSILLFNSFFFNSFLIYHIEPMLNFWEERVYGDIDQTFKFYIENANIPKIFVFTDLKCGATNINGYCIWPGNYLGHIVLSTYFLPNDISNIDQFEFYFDLIIKTSYLLIVILYSLFILKRFNLTVLKIFIIFIALSPYLIAWASRHHEIVSIHLLLGIVGFLLGSKIIFDRRLIYIFIVFLISLFSALTKFDYFVILAGSSILPIIYYGLKINSKIKTIIKYCLLSFSISILGFLAALLFQSILISFFLKTYGVSNVELEFFNNSYIDWLISGRVSERTTILGIMHQLNLLIRNLSIPILSLSIFDLISVFPIFLFSLFYLIFNYEYFITQKKSNIPDELLLILCAIIQILFIYIGIYLNYGGLNHLQEEIIMYFSFLPLMIISLGIIYNNKKNFISDAMINSTISSLFLLSFHIYFN